MNAVSPDFIASLKDASVFTPELPEAAASETLAKIEHYERMAIRGVTEGPPLSVTEYAAGSARYSDEVRVYGAVDRRILLSADHATAPYKESTGEYRGADHGTAGLAMLLSAECVQAIVPLGKQTGNVAVSPDDHPIKRKIGALLPGKAGFISLHGMASGKLITLQDATEIHAVIGLGTDPNEKSWAAAEKLVGVAKGLGVRAVIGNRTPHHVYNPATDDFERDDQGNPKTGELKAHRRYMTTNFAYRVMAETGQPIPSLQLEMTRLLRLVPADFYDGWHADRKAQAMGVHLGYLLAMATVDTIKVDES